MDEKDEVLTSEDDWDDLFGVDYFADEAAEEDIEDATESEDTDETDPAEETDEESHTEGSEEESEATDEEEPEESEIEEEDTDEEAQEDSEAEEVAEDEAKPADDAANILTAVQSVDPTIESFNDLEDVGLFALLIDQGKTPEEALRESSPKLQAKLAAAQKAASKKHLRSTATSGKEDAIDMDAIKAFRAIYPNKSEREAIEIYKRVKAQK